MIAFNRTGRKEVSIIGVRRVLGHWRLLQFDLARNPRRDGRYYGMAAATIGPYPVLQFHAWVNTDQPHHLGAYWSVRLGHLQATLGVVDGGCPSRHADNCGCRQWISLHPRLFIGERP